MALIQCEECGKKVSDRALSCPHCGNPLDSTGNEAVSSEDLSFAAQAVDMSAAVKIKSGRLKRYSWFILANFAIVASLAIISGGALLSVTPFVIILGCIFPFITLLFSKWLAKRSHRIHIIEKGEFQTDTERNLYRLVESISVKAGIKKTPEIGIYPSADANAFATGPSKNRSMVAFSSGLLEKMDAKAIAAVAAHEVAHIANGDMVTLSLVQSVVNTIVLICTIPLLILEWLFSLVNDDAYVFFTWLVFIFRFIFTLFLVFLGSLVVKAYSRKREFEADKLAARLLDTSSMIHALESLKRDKPVFLKHQKSYAAMKINSPRRWMDFLSTHPSLDRRIKALQKGQKGV